MALGVGKYEKQKGKAKFTDYNISTFRIFLYYNSYNAYI